MICYQCRHRRTVAGSVHSSCNYLREKLSSTLDTREITMLEIGFSVGALVFKQEEVTFNQTGVQRGWALWPTNFDPAWLEVCKLFEEKM